MQIIESHNGASYGNRDLIHTNVVNKLSSVYYYIDNQEPVLISINLQIVTEIATDDNKCAYRAYIYRKLDIQLDSVDEKIDITKIESEFRNCFSYAKTVLSDSYEEGHYILNPTYLLNEKDDYEKFWSRILNEIDSWDNRRRIGNL